MKKTIILHDTFLYKGGGERLIMMMGKALDADIASGFFSKGSFDLRSEGFKGKLISISSEVFTKGFRHFKLKYAFMFKTKFLSDYDNIIFSGDCISAVRNTPKKSKKIYYCHTPPRYLYDLHELYVKKVPFLLRPAFKICCSIFKYLYEKDLSKIDLILTNSKNTQSRIKKHLKRESTVLYPPVDLDEFRYLGQSDYYLSFARLSDAKRVDRVVEAFKQMPDKKLVVIYGENDPQKEKIFEIAKDSKNIELVTLPGNAGFKEYVGNCLATIYVPIDEDFGMSPVESMAAGKPVIGVDDGGLKETIINGKTGILIDKSCKVEDIIRSVNELTDNKCLDMKESCISRANDFSLGEFKAQIKNHI